MTNRLELNWKLDGFVDEQRYYCSETPIDVNDLPIPKAILAGEARTYTDTAIEAGKTYHVRIGSVKGGVEKISNEIVIVALNLVNVASLLLFQDYLKDETGKTWTSQGSVVVSDGAATFSTNGAIESQNSSDFAYGTGDFEWNIELELNSISGNQYIIDHDAGNKGTLIYFNDSLKYYNTTTGEYSPLYVTPIPLSIGVKHSVKVKRVSNVTSIYVDDVLKASATDTHNYIVQKVWVGRYPPQGGYFLNGKIHRFEIKNFQ